MKSPCHTNKKSNFLPFFHRGHLSMHQFYSLHSSICGNTDNQFITIHVFCNGQFFLFPRSHFYSKALDNIQHIPSYLFLYTLSRIIYAFCECWYIFSHSFYKICSFYLTKKCCQTLYFCIIILREEKYC